MNRKGITPVVGAVLLISISVAASVSAFAFLNDLRTDIQDSSEERIEGQTDQLQKEIDIENVYRSSDGYTLLSVRNTGEQALSVKSDGENSWSQFVDGRPKEWKFLDSSKQSSDYVGLEKDDTVKINTTKEYPNSDQEMNIKITGTDISDTYICYHQGSPSC